MSKATKMINKLKKHKYESQWYNLRPILGCANWAVYYILLGARETSKSYSVEDFFVSQFINEGIPFYWLRLTDAQAKKLLQNNAAKLIDADIKRRYNLDLVTNGSEVYNVTKRSEPDKNGKTKILEKKLMCHVFSLSTSYNQKGSLFDKDFLNDPKMRFNICLDEFERLPEERNTFDIVSAFKTQIENIVRSEKDRVKCFLIANKVETCGDLLTAFNFIPEEFGMYKLVKNKKKLLECLTKLKKARGHEQEIIKINKEYENVDFGQRAVIHYLPNSEAYTARRHGTLASILDPNDSNFTNKIETDRSLLSNDKLLKPRYVIAFTKNKDDWFTVWNNNIIARYNKEKIKIIPMRRYLDQMYNEDLVNQVIVQYDTRNFLFHNLLTHKLFEKNIQTIKPAK